MLNEIATANNREKILLFEEALSKTEGAQFGDQDDCSLKHTFVPGMYVREMFAPKGKIVVTKIHKITHPYFVLKGVIDVITENGIKRIEAPFQGITEAGTKRVCKIVEDTIWVTIHQTKETDLEKIEEEVIAKTFDEIEDNAFDIYIFRELTKDIIANEKDGFWSDWTEEQQQLYASGDWRNFSQSRGYSEENISDFQKWLDMIDSAKELHLDPYEMIRDLSIKAAFINIEKDKNGEIALSSHIPLNKKENKLCHGQQ